MENAGHRVVEFLAERCRPLAEQRIVVLCGKGNNGGDGLVIARQLFTRIHPESLARGAAGRGRGIEGRRGGQLPDAPGVRMPGAARDPAGGPLRHAGDRRAAGHGHQRPRRGRDARGHPRDQPGFPLAKVAAVDIPSGMPSDSPHPVGEFARADWTVTFTAPKPALVLPPNCDHAGELQVGPIGSPESLYEDAWLSVIEPRMFRELLAPRPRDGHKGTFGHVLVVGGSRGKTGAPAMSGLAALRAGAGLVTVASAAERDSADRLARAGADDGAAQRDAARLDRHHRQPGNRGGRHDRDRDGAGAGARAGDLRAGARRDFLVRTADGAGCRRPDRRAGRKAGPHPRAHSASGRDVPPDRQVHRRRAEGPRGDGAHIRHQPAGDPGIEGRADADRVSRRPRMDQSHRHARAWAPEARATSSRA